MKKIIFNVIVLIISVIFISLCNIFVFQESIFIGWDAMQRLMWLLINLCLVAMAVAGAQALYFDTYYHLDDKKENTNV